MAGYSGTPLAQKLGIAVGARVLVSGAPKGFVLDVPHATVVTRTTKKLDVAVVFVLRAADIGARFAAAAKWMTPAGGVWLAWPKKASKIETDVTEHALRDAILETGWVDNKVCAIDERYSGLRFVLRRELRPR